MRLLETTQTLRPLAEQALAKRWWAPYAAAAGLVAATVGLRFALDPILEGGVFYHLYYPAVILATYLFGGRVGFFAMLLAGACAFFLFALPNPGATPVYLGIFFFLLSSAVLVFVLARVRRRLDTLTQEYRRIDTLTQAQADLFREHAGRVSDHLQLVSALLQINASEETREMHARALMNAASRTMLISRMHRAFAHEEDAKIDFQAFAVRLADAALAARNRPPLTVVVEGEKVLAPLEQATALGIALLECINARAGRNEPGVIKIEVLRLGEEGVFQVSEEGGRADWFGDARVVGAIAEQLRGNLVVSGAEGAAALRLTFPTKLAPLPQWTPLAPLN
ncbi:MAG: sensor histidine kinase [Hyphomonadaceae bacterium]|nr:sensor histidine kinase [Hyphomonadaceae bacterium]